MWKGTYDGAAAFSPPDLFQPVVVHPKKICATNECLMTLIKSPNHQITKQRSHNHNATNFETNSTNFGDVKGQTLASQRSGSTTMGYGRGRGRGGRDGGGEARKKTCYLCGETGHYKAQCPQVRKHDVCFRCRKQGHRVNNCPLNKTNGSGGDAGGEGEGEGEGEGGKKGKKGKRGKKKKKNTSVCYNCGSKRHSLRKCPHDKIGSGFEHAECYVCGEKGHLASSCPSNINGIYPDGGACKKCGSKYHTVRMCDADVVRKQQSDAPPPDDTLDYVVFEKVAHRPPHIHPSRLQNMAPPSPPPQQQPPPPSSSSSSSQQQQSSKPKQTKKSKQSKQSKQSKPKNEPPTLPPLPSARRAPPPPSDPSATSSNRVPLATRKRSRDAHQDRHTPAHFARTTPSQPAANRKMTLAEKLAAKRNASSSGGGGGGPTNVVFTPKKRAKLLY